MRDPKVFLKLLQLDLAAHPPGAPVCKLWIAAEPARPRSAQRGLFLPITPEAEKLEITLARITGVVGERRAGIARCWTRIVRMLFAWSGLSSSRKQATESMV